MLPDDWQAVQRLLVVLWDGSDGGHAAQPTVCLLRQTLPATKITAWVLADTKEPLALLPWIDDLLRLDAVELEGQRGADSTIEHDFWVHGLRDRQFDAAIFLTPPLQSPYPLAYRCYLAGIPLRLGQSPEFGGGVLSHWVKPLPDPSSLADHYRFLLTAIGITDSPPQLEVHSTQPSRNLS